MPSSSPTKFVRPVVVVSKCLMGARCRWDADTARDPFLRLLAKYARLIPVCPEVEIGLGTARGQIILVSHGNGARLYQPSTRRQLTRTMNSFAGDFLNDLKRVDGFLLRQKSPSCGLRKVKRHESAARDARFRRDGVGLFAAQVSERFGHLPVEDEERLGNANIREHWLTRLYTLAAFHEAMGRKSANSLKEFHGRHRLLLDSFGKRLAKQLGTLSEAGMSEAYRELLYQLLSRHPRRQAKITPCKLALDYYRSHLKRSEIAAFEMQIQAFLDGTTALSELRERVQIWAVRYDKDFVRQDAVYQPYPGTLA